MSLWRRRHEDRMLHRLSVLLLIQCCSSSFLPPPSTSMNLLATEKRKQCPMQKKSFPCQYRKRSVPETDNVNRLQPADISIVAALGDSVIGSTGASAPNFLSTREQYRGVSFAIGQTGSWETVMTLPNFLREFNPRVVGGSTNQGGEDDPGSNLNLASPGATSVELIEQAKKLIKTLHNPVDDKRWKLVTILIGHNDICTHPCNTSYTSFDASPPFYRNRVMQVLDMLRDNLPRTFVNWVPLLDITITLDMTDKPPFCYISHPYVCPCLYTWPKGIPAFGGIPLGREGMKSLQRGYVEELEALINSGRYERPDFTVVVQPAFTELELFKRRDFKQRLVNDYSYFAPDCLHPSQKLHGLMARALWNNMLSPLGSKATSWSKDPPFLCPSPQSPFLATRSNSLAMDTVSMEEDYISYMRKVTSKRLKCYI